MTGLTGIEFSFITNQTPLLEITSNCAQNILATFISPMAKLIAYLYLEIAIGVPCRGVVTARRKQGLRSYPLDANAANR
jgi:hypothetical protein